MKGIKRDNFLRFCLTAVFLGMLVCIGILIFNMPGIDCIEVIPINTQVEAVRNLQLEEELVQPIYIYRDFDRLSLFRTNSETKNIVKLEITQNDQSLFSENLVFATGESKHTLNLSGTKGTLILRIVNLGDVPLSLPLVGAGCYDIGNQLGSEEPLLQIGISHHTNIVKWIYGVASLVFFFLSSGILWGWGKRWTLQKAILFILIICLSYSLLFPAWNVNDFSMHFMTSWSYANTLLGTGPDGRDQLMVREDDAELFTYVLNDRNQIFFQPTVKSYDDAVTYLFQRTEKNQMVSFECDNSVHRENGIWSYLPYILGILIARLLSLNLITAVFLARLCGLAFCITGLWLALRKLPGKMLVPVTILSCVPICAMNLGAISYDGPCYVAVLCFFAYIVSLRNKYKPRDAIFLIFLSLALSLVKRGAYTPFILSLPLLLSGRNKNSKRLIICCMLTAGLGLLYNYRNIIWGRISLHTFTSVGWGTYDAKWAFQHPLDYFVLMVRSYLRQTDKIYDIIGRCLGWNKAVIPEFVCGLFYLLLILSSILPDRQTNLFRPFCRLEMLWIWLPVTILSLLLPSTMLSYTFLTSEIIDGPQGRYYLPLLVPLLMLCCFNLQKKISLKSDSTILLFWSTAFLHLVSIYYIALGFLNA